MPIKPENRHRYPADWKQRRLKVLERAGNRCELCGAPNGEHISRMKNAPAVYKVLPYPHDRYNPSEYREPIRVVLTVAHLDPTYHCHDLPCLLALCQRCHLKIDAHIRHQARAALRGEGECDETV